jgi:glycosyltransferase involved in cell wall biosynthesis
VTALNPDSTYLKSKTLAMQKPLPLSVCMISGAEAPRIGRALESVASWTAEVIIVLNDDVTDDTQRIATEYGARVFPEKWRGFIAQKNSALAKATQPWLLGLDADEVVSLELRAEIMTLFASAPEKSTAYSMPRCSFYFGRWIRHGDWYPDRCTRLWQRGKARWIGTDPHAALEVDGATSNLRHDLLHYTTETLNHQVNKTVQYAEDFARHCAVQGRRVSTPDLVVRPAWRFIRAYFLKLGFLDGWQGYSIAWLTAFYTFLRYAKAREVQNQSRAGTQINR